MTSGLHRRHVLSGTTAVVVGLPVLAACGSDSDSDGDAASDPSSSTDPTDSADSPSSGASESGGGAAAAIAATADIPVGGCAVFPDQKCVITQPTEGDFKAFSSVCTHQGCTVSAGTDGVIPCTCHGSEFSLDDGSVLQGPATSSLAEVAISVEGDSISLA